jgi:peroxiredoxin Q/BCP
MLAEGQPFPSFNLPDQSGEAVSLESLKGAPAVIYFYPKDDTPGCTTEACEFRDLSSSFHGARIIGVSPDSAKKHQKFIDKHSLGFTLLADEEKKLIEACGFWVEKSMYGKTYMGVERSTVLIDGEGIVRRIWVKVKPKGHAAEVQKAASELG